MYQKYFLVKNQIYFNKNKNTIFIKSGNTLKYSNFSYNVTNKKLLKVDNIKINDDWIEIISNKKDLEIEQELDWMLEITDESSSNEGDLKSWHFPILRDIGKKS